MLNTDVRPRDDGLPHQAPPEPNKIAPVKLWAVFGAAYLVFAIAVLTHWVTSPLFKRVPPGPTPVPTYMKDAILFFEFGGTAAALACIYFIIIRPWRRDGRLSVDGAIIIGTLSMFVQDPLSSNSGHWFSYNAWGWNMGSWVNSVPFGLGKAAPGAMLVEPVGLVPAGYVWSFAMAMYLGSWVMKKARDRWPHLSSVSLILICLVTMWGFDFVVEGLMFCPLGVWQYGGGHFAIFSGHYYRFPMTEPITAGALYAGPALVRFFKNDRGETIADRGLESLPISNRRKSLLRALAAVGVFNAIMFMTFNMPNTWSATRSEQWPADVQRRSYFTSGICGEGTNQMCPGPAVPQYRNDNQDPNGGSAHLDPDGKLVIPPNTVLPSMVPFDRGK